MENNTTENIELNANQNSEINTANEQINPTNTDNNSALNKYPEQWAWASRYESLKQLSTPMKFPNQNKEAEMVFEKKDSILSVAVTILAVLFSRLVLFNSFGLFTSLFFIIVFSILLIYFKSKNKEINSFCKIIAGIGYIFSVVFFITDSRFIDGLDFIFEWLVFAYLAYSLGTNRKSLDDSVVSPILKSMLEIPFSEFKSQLSVSAYMINGKKKVSNIKSVLIGLVIGFPLFLIICGLLMEADDNMKNIMNDFFDTVFSDGIMMWMTYLICAFPCSLYIFSTIFTNSVRNGSSEPDKTESSSSAGIVNNIIYYIAVTPVILLYVLFFILQASYYLSAFQHKLPLGYETFSEYARKGFFELLTVAVFNTLIMLIINYTSKEKTKVLKFYNVTLSISTIFLIITAISKMVMYVDGYGLTQDRVYASWFMVLLGILFVIVIIKQFKENLKISKCFTGAFLVMFAILCFSRPDAVIAKYNIEMYRADYLLELDTDALLRLSDDGKLVAVNNGVVTAEDAWSYSETLQKGTMIDILNISSLILNEK